MDKTRATALVHLLRDLFPGSYFPEESQVAYITAIGDYKDEQAAYDTITEMSKHQDKLPSLAEITRGYAEKRRRAAEAHERERRLLEEQNISGYGSAPPEWVQVWWWLRHEKGIFRSLPQQYPHGQDYPLSQIEYEAYREEWLAAGAPSVTTKQVIDAAGRTP